MSVTILLVAKAPVPGQAKTRLCPPLLPAQSAGVAAAALLDTLETVRRAARQLSGPPPVVALSGDIGAAARSAELTAQLLECRVIPQWGEMLGERLSVALPEAARGGAVLQIGMDTPQVSAHQLVELATGLSAGRDVLAPAEDGGWWALGLRDASRAQVLRGVPMSTRSTGTLTLQALRAAGADPDAGPVLRDVDTWPDATAVAELAPDGSFGREVQALQGLLAMATG